MVSLKGRVGRSSRYSRGYRPRRRFYAPRKEATFWIPWQRIDSSGSNFGRFFKTDHLTVNARKWITLRHDAIYFAPNGPGTGWQVPIQSDAADQYSIARKALHIHRWDGPGFLLGQSNHASDEQLLDDSPRAAHNHSILWYYWSKVNRRAQDMNPEDVTLTVDEDSDYNIALPQSDVYAEILKRRDVRRWGMVEVWGNTYEMLSDINGNGTPSVLWQRRHERPIARLPLPKLGAKGITLEPGEELVCWVQSQGALESFIGQADPQFHAATSIHRPVIGMPALRMLCSVR